MLFALAKIFSIVNRRIRVNFQRQDNFWIREALRMCPRQGEGQMFIFKLYESSLLCLKQAGKRKYLWYYEISELLMGKQLTSVFDKLCMQTYETLIPKKMQSFSLQNHGVPAPGILFNCLPSGNLMQIFLEVQRLWRGNGNCFAYHHHKHQHHHHHYYHYQQALVFVYIICKALNTGLSCVIWYT